MTSTALEALRASRDFVTRMDTPSRSEQATVADMLAAAIAAEEARLLPLGHAFDPPPVPLEEHALRCWHKGCGQPRDVHEAQPRPISKELRAAAERAVEAQANDTRTLDQKIADGVAFIVDGPSDRDLQPFSAQPSPAEPIAWAVMCANGKVCGLRASAPVDFDMRSADALCSRGPHRAVPLVEQGTDAPSTFDRIGADRLADEVGALIARGVIDSRSPAADALLDYRQPPNTPRCDRLAESDGLRERLRALAGEFRKLSNHWRALKDVGVVPCCGAKADVWADAGQLLAALLEQAPSTAREKPLDTARPFSAAIPCDPLALAEAAPTEREAALVEVARRAKVWIGHHGHASTQWEARQWELLLEELQRTLAAYEERM